MQLSHDGAAWTEPVIFQRDRVRGKENAEDGRGSEGEHANMHVGSRQLFASANGIFNLDMICVGLDEDECQTRGEDDV